VRSKIGAMRSSAGEKATGTTPTAVTEKTVGKVKNSAMARAVGPAPTDESPNDRPTGLMPHEHDHHGHRSASTEEHRGIAAELGPLDCAVVVVSDSRTQKTDRSGDVAVELIEAAGHRLVGRELIKNDPAAIEEKFAEYVGDRADFVVFCGGTGLGRKDLTVETVTPLLDKVLDGYGEAFRRFSWDEIGTAAIMSRAVGGATRGTIVICTPGSTNALRLALEKLLLPELRHLVREANR